MSWLLKSLQINDPDPEPEPNHSPTSSSATVLSSPTDQTGVKGDLSVAVIGQTIGRQLRGVAAFMAPPPVSLLPQSSTGQPLGSEEQSSSQALIGIRNDLVEIGGTIKSGFSRLSSNKAVTGISKFASNFLSFKNQDEVEEDEVEEDEVEEDGVEEEDEDEEEEGYGTDDDGFDGVPGITEEAIAFVMDISSRPELWTDFPISIDEDYKLSDDQRQHASAVEDLVPSLAALRANLQNCVKDEQFWIVYFILLLPRLSGHDSKLLSTPQVVGTRDLLLHKLQNKSTPEAEDPTILDSPQEVIETLDKKSGDWADEVDTDPCSSTQNRIEKEEVSFSDLEVDDDENDLLDKSPKAEGMSASSPSGSNDWVKLDTTRKTGQRNSHDRDSEGESSNEWHTVDDFD